MQVLEGPENAGIDVAGIRAAGYLARPCDGDAAGAGEWPEAASERPLARFPDRLVDSLPMQHIANLVVRKQRRMLRRDDWLRLRQ